MMRAIEDLQQELVKLRDLGEVGSLAKDIERFKSMFRTDGLEAAQHILMPYLCQAALEHVQILGAIQKTKSSNEQPIV